MYYVKLFSLPSFCTQNVMPCILHLPRRAFSCRFSFCCSVSLYLFWLLLSVLSLHHCIYFFICPSFVLFCLFHFACDLFVYCILHCSQSSVRSLFRTVEMCAKMFKNSGYVTYNQGRTVMVFTMISFQSVLF